MSNLTIELEKDEHVIAKTGDCWVKTECIWLPNAEELALQVELGEYDNYSKKFIWNGFYINDLIGNIK